MKQPPPDRPRPGAQRPDRDPVRPHAAAPDAAPEPAAADPLDAGDPRHDPGLMAALLDASSDVIFVKDLGGRYRLVNAACARSIGRPAHEILGRTAHDLFRPEDVARIVAIEREVLLRGEARAWEGRYVVGGRPTAFRITIDLWRHDGVVRGWLGVAQNVTATRDLERELARSASVLRATLDATADAILIRSTADEIVSYNRKFLEVWGISEDVLAAGAERAISRVRDKLVDPVGFETKIRELYERPLAESIDILAFRDGRVLERHSKPQILDGEVVGRVYTFRDVTQRHDTEQALRASEARYRDLFENAHDIVYTHDLDGRFLEVNRRGIELSGFSANEILDLNIRDVIAPEQLAEVVANIARGVAGEAMPVVQLEILTKRGTRIPLEVSSRILREGGAPIAVQGIARDVSERRRAARAAALQAETDAALARVGRALIGVLASPAVLERLCELVSEVLHCDGSTSVLLSADGRTVTALANAGRSAESQEVMRALRWPTEVARSVVDRLSAEDVVTGTARDFGPTAEAVIRAFGVDHWLVMALRRGDRLVGVQIAGRGPGAPTFSEREIRLATGVAQLASMALENARLLEELERSSVLKSEFVATMSHELRTPLSTIIGYQELLADGSFGELNAAQADIVDRLRLHARALLGLVDGILDLERIEGGRVHLTLEDVALRDVLSEVESETRELREGRPVELRSTIAPEAERICSDRTKLKLILKNLISNALKFTERGAVDVEVAATAGALTITVRDTGVGIEREAQRTIFEPFRQAAGRPRARAEGVGLGLHIVRRLSEMLGGTVTLESAPGVGSTFLVSLPVPPPSEG